MNRKEFICKYDYEGSIVLLEGKRQVNAHDINKLYELGRILASETKHILFRSGNASGSDYHFSKGVISIDNKRLQNVIPYSSHRRKYNVAYETISLNNIDLVSEPLVIYHSKSNKKTEKLIDRFISGANDRFSIKAAYIIRDTVKVIGASGISPATFGIFYDDLKAPRQGGTGHTMNICELNNVPFVDQSLWFNWVR